LEDITGKVRVESFPNLVSGQDIDWLPAIQNSQEKQATPLQL
jgi:hypothetical protein